MDKRDFLGQLKSGLNFLPPAELSEILDEFEQHFAAGLAQGKTEQELTAQLGDPARIVEGYRQDAMENGGVSEPDDVREAPRFEHPRPEQPRREQSRRGGSTSGFVSDISIHEQFPLADVKDIEVESSDSDIRFELHDESWVRVDIDGMAASDIYCELRNGRLRVVQEFRIFRLFHWRKQPDIVIGLPRAFGGTLKITTAAGDVRLPGFKGYALKVNSASGDFKMGDLYANEISLGSVSGDFDCGKLMGESIDISTTAGDLSADCITTNSLRVTSVSGDIDQRGGAVWEAKTFYFKTVSGDIGFAANDHWQRMDFTTVSGDIKLILPRDSAHFEVQLSSVSGKVKSRFGNDSYSGRTIKAKTVSGDLVISEG